LHTGAQGAPKISDRAGIFWPGGKKLWCGLQWVRKQASLIPKFFSRPIGEGRNILTFPKKQTIYRQGDEADSVFYVQKGKLRLTVVSKAGKEATIGIVIEGELYRRRFTGWSGSPHGIRRRHDGLRASAGGKEGDGAHSRP
jgi:hypothetical protein